MTSLTGKWIGKYSYDPESHTDPEKQFGFKLDLIEENEEFQGTCIDSLTKDIFKDPIKITGFMDDEFISFVKQYPHLLYIDEHNTILSDPSKEHPEITYSGYYDKKSDSFSGTFELYINPVQKGFGWLEDIITGSWSMYRSK